MDGLGTETHRGRAMRCYAPRPPTVDAAFRAACAPAPEDEAVALNTELPEGVAPDTGGRGPLLGEHDEPVLDGLLGLPDAASDRLVADGVIA